MDPRALPTLLAIMRALRTPGTGCPWDLEQSFETIAPYTIEEAYEVADAIAREAHGELREELGDLLLQVVYHAQIADEEGFFRFEDVVEAICRKMLRRHPHVFGDEAARSAGAAKGFWEDAKAKEKKSGGRVLDGVPVVLPALTRALKLQAKAARVGFDWPDVQGVLDKIVEESRELATARASGDEASIEDEFGDLLFAVANLARHLDIDPEAALRSTNAKFERRFRHVESVLESEGRSPQSASLEEMEALWQAAKTAQPEAAAREG
ncbi:MAG: nucleoside triphosphate pyrophosphohydrolase [Parvibaculaceae bacterium]